MQFWGGASNIMSSSTLYSFSFVKGFSHWVFLDKGFNEAIWRRSKDTRILPSFSFIKGFSHWIFLDEVLMRHILSVCHPRGSVMNNVDDKVGGACGWQSGKSTIWTMGFWPHPWHGIHSFSGYINSSLYCVNGREQKSEIHEKTEGKKRIRQKGNENKISPEDRS